MKKLIYLFTSNPSVNEVFQTSDGYNFLEESFADAHANSLKDKTVTPITKAEVMAEVEVTDAEEVKPVTVNIEKLVDTIHIKTDNPKDASDAVNTAIVAALTAATTPALVPTPEPQQEPAAPAAQEPAAQPAPEPQQEPATPAAQEPAAQPAKAAAATPAKKKTPTKNTAK